MGVTSLSSKQQAAHRAPRPLVSFVEFDLTPLRVCDGKMEAAGGLLRTEKCLHERALETTMGHRPILWIGKLSSDSWGLAQGGIRQGKSWDHSQVFGLSVELCPLYCFLTFFFVQTLVP